MNYDFQFDAVFAAWPLLLRGTWMTIQLSALAMIFGLAVAILCAWAKTSGPAPMRWLVNAYVEVIRGTPLVLQLYLIFFLLPELGLSIPAVVAAILGLAINYSAYEAEIYRAGLQAIPRGQMEAALSLGMKPARALRVVIIPQAVRIVIPPVTNDFIALFKDTSVCSVILVTELTRQYNELYNFNRDLIVELAAVTAGLYLLMSYPLALLARRLENRSRGKPR